MSDVLRFLIMVFLVMTGMMLNMGLSTHGKTAKYLKEGIEVAVHDGALELDTEQLANGLVVFDQPKARSAFIQSFEQNTGLTSSEYEVIDLAFLDHSIASFPADFQATGYDFRDSFDQPTLLAIVKVKVGAYFMGGGERDVVEVASYTYDTSDFDAIGTTAIMNYNAAFFNANRLGYHWPVPSTGRVTSELDPHRVHPTDPSVIKAHNGFDIADAGVEGAPVVAMTEGKVIYADVLGGYGNLVMIDHGNGLQTRYAHLQRIDVNVGDQVYGGQQVGTVGNTGDSTGPHLHFEVRENDVPQDPNAYVQFQPNKNLITSDQPPDTSQVERVTTMTATAYTAYCPGCSGTTYLGTDLRANPNEKVIAVDPDVIPLGSKVYVEGYGYAVADDIGSAIKGNIIDLFIPEEADALMWGRQQVKVHVLK